MIQTLLKAIATVLMATPFLLMLSLGALIFMPLVPEHKRPKSLHEAMQMMSFGLVGEPIPVGSAQYQSGHTGSPPLDEQEQVRLGTIVTGAALVYQSQSMDYQRAASLLAYARTEEGSLSPAARRQMYAALMVFAQAAGLWPHFPPEARQEWTYKATIQSNY